MKIAICDDEMKERETLNSMIKQYCDDRKLVCEITFFASGEEIIESENNYRIIFLDISMKGLDGIETGKILHKKNNKTKIIYVTSYKEYCNRAVNMVHAYAYLTKPIYDVELYQQLDTIISEIDENEKKEIKVEFYNVLEILNGIATEKNMVQLPVKDINYFKYIKQTRKIDLHTRESVFAVSTTMIEIEERMKIYGFETCCRGFLVNLAYVQKIKGLQVFLLDGTVLPVSQKRIVAFKDILNEYIQRSC